ncbi:ABC transporter substrate-binding protein [Paenibacillus eucommiae]|uniref:Multiple sugar transport system substrate-binding protein n=1 Tax=Paenibacillus eucommiae TaxID=1355755 RepID=A0ABS4JCP0_9BACL|nr:extracellular solute-binding protein [Paenibacillus eucommiae]MBP1996836.1 multiple sugar transport system substrate-binding protein [Paenibacillus eucommiae]
MKSLKIILGLLIMIAIVSGCSKGTDKEANQGTENSPVPAPTETAIKEPVEELEPVTLKLYHPGGYFSEQDFKSLLADPVKKKYKHITLEMVATPESLENLFAAGEQIDLYATFYGNLKGFEDLNFLGDITPLAEKYNFDLSRFDQGALDAVRAMSDKGELYALPYARNINGLYYNKDIFDKFAIPYPKDGMTWEEATELAKKLTSEVDGVKYRGIAPQSHEVLLFQKSLAFVDAKTDAVMEDIEPYKAAFEVGKQIYSIAGNEYDPNPFGSFFEAKNLAMFASVNLFHILKTIPELNWDVAQFPSFSDKPNIGTLYDLHVIAPNKNSKHQDDIMRVMEVLFSDEVQMDMVRKNAKVSTLADAKYKEQFGQDIPELQGKSIDSVFKTTPAPAPGFSPYLGEASVILGTKYAEYMQGQKDVNTALREAKEEIEKHIAAVKQK